MALPLSGMWQWFTGMELAAYSYLCILLCHWIWFGNSMGEKDKELLKILVGFGVVICVLCFGAFAWATKLSCNLSRSMVPLLALGAFCTRWISLHLLCS